jgi:hypothetical protein
MPSLPTTSTWTGDPIGETEAYTVYLPCALRTYGVTCLTDDFSDPTTGWPNGAAIFGRAAYVEGVYRMIDAPPLTMLFIGVSPDWEVPNDAAIRVRGRIDVGEDPSIGYYPSFGLVFGLKTYDAGGVPVWIEWYSFSIAPHAQYYSLKKWSSGGSYTVLASGNSNAILTDPLAWQALEVRRSGDTMTLVVNDAVIRGVTDASNPYSGRRSVGIGAGDVFTVTFDDFTVCASDVISVSSSAAW